MLRAATGLESTCTFTCESMHAMSVTLQKLEQPGASSAANVVAIKRSYILRSSRDGRGGVKRSGHRDRRARAVEIELHQLAHVSFGHREEERVGRGGLRER